MEKPLVSIIIPSYHRGEEIVSRALISALNQSYDNLEIILIDDNVSDDSSTFRQSNINLFNSIKKYDNRIKLILNNKQLGGALSRNEGIKASTGDYITFLDDDDYYKVDKVAHQLDCMICTDCNLSYTDLSLYDKNEKVIDRRLREETANFNQKQLLKYHLMKNLTGTETFMFKSDFLREIGLFDNVKMGHEYYLMMKALLNPNLKIKYYKSDDIVAFRTDSISISNGPQKIKGEKELYKFKKQYFYLLNKKEKRYLKFRHRAVLGISYSRRKNYAGSIFYFMAAFFTSPKASFAEYHNFKEIKRM